MKYALTTLATACLLAAVPAVHGQSNSSANQTSTSTSGATSNGNQSTNTNTSSSISSPTSNSSASSVGNIGNSSTNNPTSTSSSSSTSNNLTSSQAGSNASNAGNTQSITFTSPPTTASTVDQRLSGTTTQNLNTTGTTTQNMNIHTDGTATSRQENVISGSQEQYIDYGGSYTIKNVPSVNGPPLTTSNDTCMGSTSGSINGPGFGVGLGSTWRDTNCIMLKNAREMWNMGMKAAALALMCTDANNRMALEITGFMCPQTLAAQRAAEAKATGALPVPKLSAAPPDTPLPVPAPIAAVSNPPPPVTTVASPAPPQVPPDEKQATVRPQPGEEKQAPAPVESARVRLPVEAGSDSEVEGAVVIRRIDTPVVEEHQ